MTSAESGKGHEGGQNDSYWRMRSEFLDGQLRGLTEFLRDFVQYVKANNSDFEERQELLKKITALVEQYQSSQVFRENLELRELVDHLTAYADSLNIQVAEISSQKTQLTAERNFAIAVRNNLLELLQKAEAQSRTIRIVFLIHSIVVFLVGTASIFVRQWGDDRDSSGLNSEQAISVLLQDPGFKDLERDLRLKELSLTIAKEKYLDAVDLANAMLRRDPNDRSAFYLRAEAWQGHANELDQSRKKFVNEDGDADLARAARKEAIADYEIVLGMGIGSPDAGESGASIQKNEYVPKPPIIMERVADLLRREREYSRAIGWYHEAQKANSDSLENPGTQEDMDRQRRLVQKIEECRRARNEGEYLP